MTLEEFLEEYRRLAHAIQTGVAYDHQYGSQDGTPKHLRTGLNCVMSDFGSLSKLLIEKGIITEQEYYSAVLDGLKREITKYEARLSRRMKDIGTGDLKITLG
jgi:hypothetical protein